MARWIRPTEGGRIRDADEVLVLLKLFANEAAEPALARLREALAALPQQWSPLRRRHVNSHQELFRRLTFSLGHAPALSVDQLLRKAYAHDVADALIEKMAFFGRHLLISSSRPGGWPANLQGVWNGDYQPAWSSDYHNDENIHLTARRGACACPRESASNCEGAELNSYLSRKKQSCDIA